MFTWLRKLFGIKTYEEEMAEMRAKANEEIRKLGESMRRREQEKAQELKEKKKQKDKIKQARALVKKKKLKRVYRMVDGTRTPCYVDNSGDIVTYGLLAYLLLDNNDSPSLEQNYDNYMDSHQYESDNMSDSSADSSYDSGDDGGSSDSGDSGGDSGGGGD